MIFKFDDTQSDREGIYHVCNNCNFEVGDSVCIKLDWNYRYTFMKVHTAQHLVSGIFI